MRGIPAIVLLAAVLSGAPFAWAQGTPPAAQSAPAPAPSKPVPDWLKYKPAYTGEEDNIANPHRTNDEIEAWAQQAAADVLSFSRDGQDAKIKSFEKYFNPQAWQLYISYLKDSKILNMVDEEGYAVRTIITQSPQVAQRGPVNGVYHWIVRMPITISFFKKDPVSGEQKNGPVGNFYLFVDISRLAQGGGEDGIAIVNWRVMDVPRN